MNKERSQIPCVINPEKICDCPLRSLNAEYVNYAGKKDRGIRSAIQRQGYDHVSPGLIKELLTHPQGGYYTEAFNMVFEFSPVMREIRENIIDAWVRTVSRAVGYDQSKIPCPNFTSGKKESE